jgi:hypothetical protein
MIVPLMMAIIHLGIIVLQDIPFFDLIALQAVFFDGSRFLRKLSGSRSGVAAKSRRIAATTDAEFKQLALYPRVLSMTAFLLFLPWFFDVKWYPLTSMKMFRESKTSGKVNYLQLVGVRESGEKVIVRIDKAIPAPGATRHRRNIAKLDRGSPAQRLAVEELLDRSAAILNKSLPNGQRFIAFELQRKVWNFVQDPNNPEHGRVTSTTRYSVRPPDLAAIRLP